MARRKTIRYGDYIQAMSIDSQKIPYQELMPEPLFDRHGNEHPQPVPKMKLGGGDIFKNIAMPDGSTVVAADSSTDTLTLAQSGLISITGNSGSDTVTIGTPNTAQIPFLKADGSSSDIDLQTSGAISDILSDLHIPFTKADGSDVTTLVVA